jgi:hypothetical protein
MGQATSRCDQRRRRRGEGLSTKRWPSVASPFIAMNRSPGRLSRESKVTPWPRIAVHGAAAAAAISAEVQSALMPRTPAPR